MRILVLAAAFGFFLAAPAAAHFAFGAPQVPKKSWPLVLSGAAVVLWVARRRLQQPLEMNAFAIRER